MKVAAILFPAAALGSASPVRTPKSIPSRDGQNECDCSKPLYADISYWDSFCPDGYEDISTSALSMSCRQVSCSEQDYKEAQCGAEPKEETPKEETPTIVAEEPPKSFGLLSARMATRISLRPPSHRIVSRLAARSRITTKLNAVPSRLKTRILQLTPAI
ncbi:uncharacterized protein BBA_05710 [Beauveria bassiana ARSEF 2860]|uniref:Extracellular membrane protein CFEM domain-containing protein n=1 Tax=Beauveria bassiana (strain ARSEF 2860) TaxID=655819 RepID=J4KNA8_BEAB2|nr:uncharacterized protein BBA_05710 [Beauveria bassiana ARSEF 2860]EJP65379.1 hypothetical protein BBA_05710 [Beauveria bassiana ARSEF 2860]